MIYTIDPDLLAKPYAAEIAALKPVIAQLVNRYGLAGKSVLSIGAGIGLEEMAMLQCGVGQMTLVDSDESGTLKDFLPTIARDDGAVTFILDELRDETELPLVDVLYCSSLTPDELRRRDIPRRRFWRRRWPVTESPIHPMIGAAASRCLKPDGLLFVQSYASGVPANMPGFLQAWRALADLHLSEAYHYKVNAAVHLWIASRCGKGKISGPEIKAFHGRSPLSRDGIVRLQLP